MLTPPWREDAKTYLCAALRGYLTKYDCSSADINPIGSIDKTDLKRLIAWAKVHFGIPVLQEFLDAIPTAELEPITETYVQSDEVDMGMVSLSKRRPYRGLANRSYLQTYDELTTFGRLRKVNKLGPYGMFQRLVHDWGSDRIRTEEDTAPVYEPAEIALKVKRFFGY